LNLCCGQQTITCNGPAIKGGCVTRRQHRAESWYFSQKVVTVQGGYGTRFCSPGTRLIEHYECRACPDMRSIVRGTKFNASHIFIPFNKFKALQWRGPGLSSVTNLSWVQEQIAKTVTSLLIIPSVL
jgi:hypothetical protein